VYVIRVNPFFLPQLKPEWTGGGAFALACP